MCSYSNTHWTPLWCSQSRKTPAWVKLDLGGTCLSLTHKLGQASATNIQGR